MSRYRRNQDGTFDKVAGSPYAQPNFIGASPSENGEAGTVPAPLAGDEDKVLYGDGNWRTPPSPSGSGVEFPENPSGKYLKDDGSFDNVKNNGYGPSNVDRDTSIRSTDQVTIDPELNSQLEEGYFDYATNLSAVYSLFKDMLTNVWQADYTEAQTYGDFVEALYSEYDRIELWLHKSNIDFYGDGNEYPVTIKMVGEYGKVNPAYPDTDYWKFQGIVHPSDTDIYGFNGFDTLKMTIYVNPLDPELPDDFIIAVDYPNTDNPVRYEVAEDDDIRTNVFDVEIYNHDNYGDDDHFDYWRLEFDSTSQSFEFVGIKNEEVYPTPTKYLREDGTWAEPPAGNGISLPETPTGKVYQDDGTFGKKLQVDIVSENGEYGYIGANDTFIPFKSQADVSAAASAARVGNATAADVRKGKTFTNNSASGLTGTLDTEPLKVGKLTTRKNIDGFTTWTDKTWTGLTSFGGLDIWTDGSDIYYSQGSNQYVLDVSTSTWTAKTWIGLTEFNGRYIWTDGSDIYYSNSSDQYVLDVSTSTWTAKTWTGLTSFRGDDIWTDGTNFYYSSDADQYILDTSTSTWTAKTWYGFTSFIGRNVWTDGINMYMSAGSSNQWFLDVATSTWSTKTWTGDMQDVNGYDVWTDSINIYNTIPNGTYLYNHLEESWLYIGKIAQYLNGAGRYIWSDGVNIYYSQNSWQRVLTKVKTKWTV